ncbi:TPA: hypothetical protein HA259_00840 [Thermoplasmata archaeon]|nr:hypothetical protein [Thermoplasmata archaeon]
MADTCKGEEPCCPRFNTEPWDETVHEWRDKPFIRDTVRQFMHRPRPSTMEKTIGRMWGMAKGSGANPSTEDFLLLAYDPSPWKSELYMAVTKEVPGADNVRMSGKYLTKVFDGPYNSPPIWVKEMERFVNSRGEKAERYFFYFTTCPRCARIYGHNYAVVFAEVR